MSTDKNHAGRTWTLLDHITFPFPKPLADREAAYLAKHGENWDGPTFGNRIMTPGDWKYEYLGDLPADIAAVVKNPNTADAKVWSATWPRTEIYAPGGGDVTDIYNTSGNYVVHFDPVTKKAALVSQYALGMSDGESPSIDKVTGRLYFRQGSSTSTGRLKYIEKLARFKDASGTEKLLPAMMSYDGIAGELGWTLMDGIDPTFIVVDREVCNGLMGSVRGKRPLIAPNGFTQYSSPGDAWKINYTLIDQCYDYGIRLSRWQLKELDSPLPVPVINDSDYPGSHGGSACGYDGRIYIAQHSGSGGAQGRCWVFKPATGVIEYLYNSIGPGGEWSKSNPPSQWDGPADYNKLWLCTTWHQQQCPRTGAIINGGWDNSGVRRYLDGFVTSVWMYNNMQVRGRPGWGADMPIFDHHNAEPAVAPDGSFIQADAKALRYWRIYRTDWPASIPPYGYAEQFLPRALLRQMMKDYAVEFITGAPAQPPIDPLPPPPPPPTNNPPTVDAGVDQTITLPQVAHLSGGSSDPDGDPVSVTWSKVSGPGDVVFSAPTAPITDAQFSVDGDYTLQLLADDGKAQTTDTVAISVNPAPQPPPPVLETITPQVIVGVGGKTYAGVATLTEVTVEPPPPPPPDSTTVTQIKVVL